MLGVVCLNLHDLRQGLGIKRVLEGSRGIIERAVIDA